MTSWQTRLLAYFQKPQYPRIACDIVADSTTHAKMSHKSFIEFDKMIAERRERKQFRINNIYKFVGKSSRSDRKLKRKLNAELLDCLNGYLNEWLRGSKRFRPSTWHTADGERQVISSQAFFDPDIDAHYLPKYRNPKTLN